jgi:hypothetical protein
MGFRWRRELSRGLEPDTTKAPAFGRVQAGLIVLLVFLARATARGYSAALP